MFIEIPEILSEIECAAMREALGDDDLWRCGKLTAAGAAREAKTNQQANPERPAVKGCLEKIKQALGASALFNAAAQPAKFARILISRYREGDGYDAHVDAAYIDGARVDLSFTVFLNSPDDYQGGALVIDESGQERVVYGKAGALVLYPSTRIHRVEPVTRGERLACVGWVQSCVRSGDHRAALFELERLIAETPEPGPRLRLINVRNNLLRLFDG